MDKNARIFVAGHNGLVGQGICRRLRALGYERLLTVPRKELDLRRQSDVESWFARERPEYVVLAAAKVGGIMANFTYPADFIRDNLMIEVNVIDAAYRNDCKKLAFLGSSCIYPKHARQPMNEEELLTGPLEQTNEAYAVAKIAGLMMARAYHRQYGFCAISLMPTNLYGPGDSFDLQTSHVMPALIRKFHEAKVHNVSTVTLWGTGAPRREFLHVDDLADAAVFLLQTYDRPEVVNVGVGKDISIRELAELVQNIVGFQGKIDWDTSKPDGTPRKLLDVSRLEGLGWKANIDLRDGIAETYAWFCKQPFASPDESARSLFASA